MDAREYDSVILTKLVEALDTEIDFNVKPKNVCIICSDESIVAGYLVSDYANECSNVQTTVTTDTRIPGWLNEDSLVILMMDCTMKSILTNTVDRLRNTGCNIVAISNFDTSDIDGVTYNLLVKSDGKFEYLGEVMGYLLMLFSKIKVFPKKDFMDIIPSLIEKRDAAIDNFTKYDLDYYSKKNILISYPPNFRSTAGLWQTIFFRRLRVATFISEYPEYNHNEIVGWCMSPEQSKYYVNLFIIDGDTTELLDTISSSMIDVLAKSGVEIVQASINGRNNLEKNLTGFLIGEAIPKRGGKKQ